MIESGEITHCKGERLIRFRKQDIDTWMKNNRIEGDSVNKKARGILMAMNKLVSNINSAEEFFIDENPKRLYS